MNARAILVLVLLVLAACDLTRQGTAPREGAARRIGYDAFGRPEKVMLNEVVVTAAASPLLPMPRADSAVAMLIRTATAAIEVDSLEAAVALVRQVAARVGGYIANTTMQTGAGELRSATIELKVPASRFDEAMTGLKPIGKVESTVVAAEDVGEEYVDVNARMVNSRRLEQRLIELLAARTGKLKDVLDVEQALARVRDEIERYEGRLRYLNAHAAVSTISVTVHEPVPVVGDAGHSVMGDAAKQAWRNFVAFFAMLVQALGVVVPLGALAGAAWVVYRSLASHRAKAAVRGG